MCTRVIIDRPGLRPIECCSVRELARWFDGRPPTDRHYEGNAIDRMASHCLCPVDVTTWAESSGYEIEFDGIEYRAARKAA